MKQLRAKASLGISFNKYALASFIMPILILGSVYFSIGIYPGSKLSILASDAFGQYSNFFASFNTMMKSDKSIVYSWSGSLGLNYLSFISYYLGGIFTPLVYFFDNQNMPDFIYFLTLLKIGCIGVSFCFFSSRTFCIPKWGDMMLSISYALMGFTIANSEVIMWLDGILYLPLIALGINRLMDYHRPALLFFGYFFLFMSNYYIGFMVGIYSFMYFVVRLLTDKKRYAKKFFSYLLTAILAGGASMVLLLPAMIDLKMNGEALTDIGKLKTAATGPWDLVIKNMIGVYDSTRYGSIPFIYVGLLPIIFCVFFFSTKKIPRLSKICYGSLLLVLVLSFYIEGLNLFWHGFHAPNMFLFRFSFLFSFTILLLAGFGWSNYKKEDFERIVNIFIGLLIFFLIVRIVTAKNDGYDYLSYTSFILTVLFLATYLSLFFWHHKMKSKKILLIGVFISIFLVELSINTAYLVKGIDDDWGYTNRSLYNEDYSTIQSLVKQAEKESNNFYRLENVTAMSNNESFRYGYSGIGMFSSIRNRHSSYYMNTIGFRSAGTNLQIYYQNNTLITDALMGIKYNIANKPISKAGFEKIGEEGKNYLYENQNALPMGVLTDERVYQKDVSSNPEQLLSVLSGLDGKFYRTISPKIVKIENAELTTETKYGKEILVLNAKEKGKPIKIEWKIEIDEASQVYLDILPASYENLSQTRVEINADKQQSNTSMVKTGQYYSLGNYQNKQEITAKVAFEYVDILELFEPKVLSLNTEKFAEAAKKAQENGVEFRVSGRKASAEVVTEDEQVLFTTIAADKGWKAKIDGKEVAIRTINDGVLSIMVPSGKHQIEFVYLPQGFKLGMMLSICCVVIFAGYQYLLFRNSQERKFK
ncbi:copper ABC transporter permease [Enterococcus ureilyticus]|uniref:Copper ABC transporter permease n=1 Tax=Enterococcus ureilyticus TaxID=1131292 RepID=A0A1E5HDS8_9ENTE|nr:YfhO family protein [Enterococcus ureilyticus]MBM7689837.1 putative membrane protein YfhO [Enterococcus ureilyticus]OEG23098.1 copper ABC transporter permease [Enterococcus ureilyticus]